MNDLKVSLVQTSLHWENPKANLKMFEEHLTECEGSDVIFLPEMFSTGFSMNPEVLAETMDGPTVTWMQRMASMHNAVITGSIIICEGENYYNRLLWCEPDGNIKYYNKRHTFTYAGEHKVYRKGDERPTWEYKGWRIKPQVCYDLRFPVWARNDDNYDLLFYVANWPERRRYPWSTLLKARAIENMSYVVGVNRVGEDGNGINHTGDSVVLDPLGSAVKEATSGIVEVISAVLSKDSLNEARNRFHFLDDRDTFTVEG